MKDSTTPAVTGQQPQKPARQAQPYEKPLLTQLGKVAQLTQQETGGGS